MSEHAAVNQAFWDEIAPHHAASEFYAVEQFLSTKDSLGEIEKAELGPVAGLSICHLQCHIGLDTLSLAALGAAVTGLDFSAESLRVARDLAGRADLPANFVQADVLNAASTLNATYDLVFTTRGVVMWISDLVRWADNCAKLLRPGGVLYFLDVHPLAMVLHPSDSGYTLASSYFGDKQPTVTSADASYAVHDVGLNHQETREWVHPIGDVVSALAGAGMLIDFLHEHPSDNTPTSLSGATDGATETQLPVLYSVGAHLPG